MRRARVSIVSFVSFVSCLPFWPAVAISCWASFALAFVSYYLVPSRPTFLYCFLGLLLTFIPSPSRILVLLFSLFLVFESYLNFFIPCFPAFFLSSLPVRGISSIRNLPGLASLSTSKPTRIRTRLSNYYPAQAISPFPQSSSSFSRLCFFKLFLLPVSSYLQISQETTSRTQRSTIFLGCRSLAGRCTAILPAIALGLRLHLFAIVNRHLSSR